MLLLTTTAFDPRSGVEPFPDWPGPRVLAIRPGSGLGSAGIDALTGRFIVLEWLEPPASLAAVVRDVGCRLADRLRRGEGPLLALDRPQRGDDAARDPAAVPPHAVQGECDAGGRLVGLVLGEMAASSPLLPGFLRMTGDRALADGMFLELLGDALAWETA